MKALSMHLRKFLIAPVCLASVSACGTIADLPATRIGSATLTLANGMPAGTAQVYSAGGQVNLSVGITGVAPGVHGIHLHTTGACKTPDFNSAGGHLNPTSRRHGALSEDGKHAGDLPNITVQAGGSGTLTAQISGTADQVRSWLFDGDGTAIVLHADADDYKTDPSGNSGARIACGVIRPG